MVIVILGILAAVAIPRYLDLRSQAYVAAKEGVVGGVRSGILSTLAYNAIGSANTYPTSLDNTSTGNVSTSNPLFGYVLRNPVTDSNWKKTGTNVYQYYPMSTNYFYYSSTGNFQRQ